MSFPKKTRNIMIGICILCMILIPFVVVGILPFFLFPIILVITLVVLCYIAYIQIKWKKQQ
jgi:hypothetical protein